MKNERGFALIITLVITALLVALTAEFVNEVYVDTSARQGFVDGQQASLLANSGMTAARTLLNLRLSKRDIPYSWLNDLTTLTLTIQAVEPRVQVLVEEESGKLNINGIASPLGDKQPSYAIAERLFRKLDLQPELLDAVADWIDDGNDPNTNGAETDYYQTLKPPYAAKNGRLDTLEELRLVKGFDKATLDKLRPYLTVYSDNAANSINVNTAPKELLASLGQMTDDLAQRIIDYRETTPILTPTDLGNQVPGLELIAQELSRSAVIMTGQQKGTVFRIVSRATVNETVRVIEAVVKFDDGQQTVLYWREY